MIILTLFLSNVLDIYSPNQRTMTPPVDESVYEEHFPGFRGSIEQVVQWLGNGKITVRKELDGLGEPRYSFEDHRTEKLVLDKP